ncbi:MAG: His/Gly/Thr/Pro-type tRNA ligase C-terminal domain-containing protein, partial [Algoriella sp.]
DGLPEFAEKILKNLRLDYNVTYEEKDSIGKRYRRMDAIGTPICITVDHDSLDDNSVTLRFRDTMEQKRVHVDELAIIIDKEVNMKYLFEQL